MFICFSHFDGAKSTKIVLPKYMITHCNKKILEYSFLSANCSNLP